PGQHKQDAQRVGDRECGPDGGQVREEEQEGEAEAEEGPGHRLPYVTPARAGQPGSTDSRRANWCPGAPDRGSAPSTGVSATVAAGRRSEEAGPRDGVPGRQGAVVGRWIRA